MNKDKVLALAAMDQLLRHLDNHCKRFINLSDKIYSKETLDDDDIFFSEAAVHALTAIIATRLAQKQENEELDLGFE